MDQIKKIWAGASDIPGANWIIGIAGLIISILVAYYFVKLFRDMAMGGGTPEEPTDILNEFRRLRDQGTLDDEEFERLANATRESIQEQENNPTGPSTPPIVPK